MSQKTLRVLRVICIMIAVVGVYTLMLKNPEDNFLNIPIFIFIIMALALESLRPTKK